MSGKSLWQLLWPPVALFLPMAVAAIFWGGMIDARVHAAEQTATVNKTDINARLDRIETKLDWLIAKLASQ